MVVGTGLPHDWPLTDLPIYSQTPVVRPAFTASSVWFP